MEKKSQIKSNKRVKDFGEVYTAEREVKAMCDLVPREVWERIDSTFLEPTCGDGNFLVEILSRKLTLCKDERDGLKALASIVGIDILSDNCAESRRRLLQLYQEKFPKASESAVAEAISILNSNIICGDSLEIMQGWIDEELPQQMQMPI